MKTILIVDDLIENLYLLRVILEQANYQVIEAKEGKEALEKLRKNKVDLIISDILMPVMDGYMLCQECKNDAALKNIPFVFYTSTYTQKQDEEFAIKLGAAHFLRKPTDSDKVLELTQKIFSEKNPKKFSKSDLLYNDKEVLKLYSKRLISKLEQKKLDLEKEILEREKIESRLVKENEILELIANNTPIKEVFDHIILNYQMLQPEFYGSISLMHNDGVHLDLISAPKLPSQYNSAIQRIKIGEKIGSCGTAAFTKKPVIVSDISTDPLWKDYKDIALSNNLKSCWSIPILSNKKKVLGTFAIYSNTIKTPSLNSIKELNSAVSLAKIAIIKSNITEEFNRRDESYRSLINQASDAIITYTFDGSIYDFNDATSAILGYTKKEFSKLKLQDITKGKVIINNNRYKTILSGEAVTFERELIHKDKSIVEVEISAKIQNDGRILAIVRDVTTRKKNEQKLLESQYNLRQSQIVANIGSYTVNLDTMTWESSLVLDKIFDIDNTFEKNIENWSSLIHPQDKEEILSYFESCIVNNKKFNKEYRIIKHKSKRVIWVHGIGELLFDSEANPFKMIGTIQDITNRKKAELKLIASEYNLRESQKVANIGSYSIDIKTMTWQCSAIMNKIFGLTKSFEKTVENWNGLVHPDEREELQSYFETNILTNHEKFNKQYRVFREDDNQEIWVQGYGELVFDNEGNPLKMIETTQDITKRKKAELKLIESEYNLRQSQIVGNIGSYSLDIKNMTWEASEILHNIFGIKKSSDSSISRWESFVHPEDREEISLYLKNNVIKNKEKFNKEYRVVKQDTKEVIWVLGVGELVLDSKGNPIKMIGTILDITKRKQDEIALKAAKEFTDKLIMSMQEGLLIVNLEGEIIMVNDSFCQLLGYSKDELIGLNLPYPFAKKEDLELMLQTKAKVASGQTKAFQLEFIKKKGQKFLASFLSGNIKDDKGKSIALFATIKDVSEEMKVKEALKEVALKSTLKKDVILELANLVGQDFNFALNKITTLAAKTLNVDRVSIWSFNENKKVLNCQKLYISKNNKHQTCPALLYDSCPNYFKALEKNQTIIIKDTVNNTATKQLAKNYLIPNNVTSLMDVYINSGSGYYGVICFEHLGLPLRDWTPEDQEFATSIANIVSLILESTERKQAEQELKSEKDFSETLITSLHDGLSVVDLKGKHIKVNTALCEMTGFSEDELVGISPPFPYWPPEEYDNIYKSFNNPLEHLGVVKHLTFMRKNGERFPVALSGSSIKDNEGKIIAYFSTINDITLRVQAENTLKENVIRSNQRKQIIVELANLIGEDFELSLKKIANTAANALNVEMVSIWKYNSKKTELNNKLSYNKENNKFKTENLTITRDEFPVYFKTIEAENSINFEGENNIPKIKLFKEKYFTPKKVSSRIDIVIYGRQNNYGIISFESTVPNRVFSNDDESFATSIASIVSLMVESKERTIAENKITLTNQQLVEANKELSELRNQLEQENVYLRNELDLVFNYEEMVYGSAEFSNVLSEVEKVAPTNATVLLLGESGTGKELLARAIHNTGSRNKKPLIKVNCSAIPRELIESELFGHKKGSFTGAFNDKIGKFELADGGTLFLDEIGELPLDMQPKILRFLQEGEIEVVGGAGSKKLDVRVIAATNRNLIEEIKKKQFREDLYFRLNVFPIKVPALRERKDDIPLLVEHFVDKFGKTYEKQVKYISDETMVKLKSHHWPGNIRELENLIERALILSNSDTLVIPGFEASGQESKQLINGVDLSLNAVLRNHILQVLEDCQWKISGANSASEALDLKPSTLRDKMNKLGIEKPK